jgi:hypothetical protein
MSAAEISGDHEPERVVAGILDVTRGYFRFDAAPVAVTTVEDLVLVNDDRLQ